MRIGKVNGRDVVTDVRCDARDEDDPQALLVALKELVERLEGAVAGGADSSTAEVERWEGEGYLYLEAALPGTEYLDIDVNIQAGRAFIRMAL
jgi:hypothetical protein